MVGRAKSDAKKQQEASEEKAALQKVAVVHYHAELEKPAGQPREGAWRICKGVEVEHKQKTGRSIHLNHATIIWHANGGKPLQELNTEKCWLSNQEENMALDFAKECSVQGFPLSH